MDNKERTNLSIDELFREYETAGSSSNPNQSGSATDGKTKKNRASGKAPGLKKVSRKTLIAAALSVLLVLGLFVVCLVGRAKGNAAFSRGDFQQAVDSYRFDFLFSGEMKDKAMYNLGLMHEMEGNYEQAAGCFRSLGDGARDKWAEATYKWAAQLKNNGNPEQALEVLKPIEGEDSQRVKVQNLKTKIVRNYISKGMLAEAEKILGQTDDKLMSEELYVLEAVLHIKNDELDSALRILEDSGVNTPYASIFKHLKHHQYYEAAGEALDLGKEDGDLLDVEEWSSIILNWIEADNLNANQLDSQLSAMAAKALLNDVRDNIIGTDYLLGKFLGKYNPEYSVYADFVSDMKKSTRFCRVSMEHELSRCAALPNGKALVVRQQKLYPEESLVYAVDLKASADLPDALIPSCLEEVEYLIIYAYDYSKYGPYSYTENEYSVNMTTNTRTLVGTRDFYADELFLKARVTVTRLTDQYKVHDSGYLDGGSEVDTSYKGQGDARGEREWFVNEPPVIEDALVLAVDELYKFIKK